LSNPKKPRHPKTSVLKVCQAKKDKEEIKYIPILMLRSTFFDGVVQTTRPGVQFRFLA
jgi:hypothetical protein